MNNDIVILAASRRVAQEFAAAKRIPYPIIFSAPTDYTRLRALSRPIVYRIGKWKEMEGNYSEAIKQLDTYSATYVDIQEWKP